MYEDYLNAKFYNEREPLSLQDDYPKQNINCDLCKRLVKNHFENMCHWIDPINKDPICFDCFKKMKEQELYDKRTKIPFEWEWMTDTALRAKVFGGWFVKHLDASIFVPDPEHEWRA